MRQRLGINPKRWLHLVLASAYLYTLSLAYADDRNTEPNRPVPGVTITQTGLNITDKTLELGYRITNGSGYDIWVCEDVVPGGIEAFLSEDEQTLVIRRRFAALWDDPKGAFPPPSCFGSYRCLRSGERRNGCLVLPLPVHYQSVFTARGVRQTSSITHASRLELEIGFYAGSMFDVLLQTYEEAAEAPGNSEFERSDIYAELFHFAVVDEMSADRDEVVSIPLMRYSYGGKEVVQMGGVVQTSIGGCRIPYVGRPLDHRQTPSPPSLYLCTRAEITYQPSMLEFFFPSISQRSLLSPAERDYLGSLKTTVVEDQEQLRSLADGIGRGRYGGIIAEGGSAQVIGYHGTQRVTSLRVYAGGFVETESKQHFRCGSGQEGLRLATPQIQPYELRLQCAENLKDLWRRLRLYQFAQDRPSPNATADSAAVRPRPNEWCDSMVSAYDRRTSVRESFIMKPHKCPSAVEGRSHYAMNPNCETDSAGDMVLLFETKAGWNQCGGPELFAFDNHDPKGGCVLLNDGTVKFIRSREELRGLRWK